MSRLFDSRSPILGFYTGLPFPLSTLQRTLSPMKTSFSSPGIKLFSPIFSSERGRKRGRERENLLVIGGIQTASKEFWAGGGAWTPPPTQQSPGFFLKKPVGSFWEMSGVQAGLCGWASHSLPPSFSQRCPGLCGRAGPPSR